MRKGIARPVRHVRKVSEAEKRIADRLPDLVDRMLDLAMGVTIQDENRKGEQRIYEKPPDRQAAEYLIGILLKSMERRPSDYDTAIKVIEVLKSDYGESPKLA